MQSWEPENISSQCSWLIPNIAGIFWYPFIFGIPKKPQAYLGEPNIPKNTDKVFLHIFLASLYIPKEGYKSLRMATPCLHTPRHLSISWLSLLAGVWSKPLHHPGTLGFKGCFHRISKGAVDKTSTFWYMTLISLVMKYLFSGALLFNLIPTTLTGSLVRRWGEE